MREVTIFNKEARKCHPRAEAISLWEGEAEEKAEGLIFLLRDVTPGVVKDAGFKTLSEVRFDEYEWS